MQPARKRRKNAPSSRNARASIVSSSIKTEQQISPAVPPSPPTKGNATMIFNLIRSLLEEKKADQHDEHLLSTLDCLIDSLQHLRDRIKTIDGNNQEKHSSSLINHDETSPLNLSKPKIRHQARLASSNSDDMSPSTTTVSSPSPSATTGPLPAGMFPSQSSFYEKPFFPPFSGNCLRSPTPLGRPTSLAHSQFRRWLSFKPISNYPLHPSSMIQSYVELHLSPFHPSLFRRI